MEDDGPGSDDTIPHTHRPVETRAAPVRVAGQYQNIVKRVQQTVGAFTIVRHHTQIQQTLTVAETVTDNVFLSRH